MIALLAALVAPIAGGTDDVTDVAVGEILGAGGAICTGTLIAPHAVLTAAHCGDAAPLTVVLDDGTYAVTAISTHPGYDPLTLASDVAILTLDHDATLAPAALAATVVAPGDPVVLVGFGRDASGSSGTRRAVATTIARVIGPRFVIDGAGNACGGDSGGPSLVVVNGVPAIAGVTSSGDAACGTESEHVRIRAYLPWLAAHADVTIGGTLAADTPPTIAITHPGDGATMPDQFVLGVHVGDDYGALTVTVAIDGAPLVTAPVTGDDLAIPVAIAPGDHALAVTVVDASANTAVAPATLVIEPPLHDPRSLGAACWDASDCDSGACEDHVCAVACAAGSSPCGGGGCSTTATAPGIWWMALALALRRRRPR